MGQSQILRPKQGCGPNPPASIKNCLKSGLRYFVFPDIF